MPKSGITRWLKSSEWADRALTGIALSPVAVLLVRQFTELGNRTVPCCDFAALELGTRAFLRGEQLVGLYSREGWRHPGPAPFLWSSLTRPLPGHSFAEHQIAAVLLALVAMVTVIAASWGQVKPVGRSVIIALVAVFLLRFGVDTFRAPWNPYEASLWTIVAVVSTAVFVQVKSAKWVGVTVLSGSMAAQTHVGAAPSIVVCLTVIAMIVFRNRQSRSMVRAAWTTGGLLSILWFLPLADLAFGNRNLWQIVSMSSSQDVAMDRSEILTGVMWILGNSPGRIGETFGTASPFLDSRSVIFLDVLAIIVVVGLALLAVLRREKDPFAATLSMITLASTVVTVVALLVAEGPFLRYLLMPIAGLGLLLWVVAGLVAVRFLQRYEHNVLRVLAWPIVMTLSVVSIMDIDDRMFTDGFVDNRVQNVVEQIQGSCSALPDRSVVRVDDDVDWFDALPIVVALDDCVTVRILGHIGFLAGQPYRAENGSDPNVFITARDDSSTKTVIARGETLTVSRVEDDS